MINLHNNIQSKNYHLIILLTVISVLLFTVNTSYASLNASAGGSHDHECDHPVNSNVENVNGCGGGCSGGGGLGGGGGDDVTGGDGTPSCSPFYVSCVSAANACGWVNYGRQDIACGGGCSARTPELPKFKDATLKPVEAGAACSAQDACGKVNSGGIMSCMGTCELQDITAVCSRENGAPDSFETALSWVIHSPWSATGSTSKTWPPKSSDKYVALKVFPPIVKKQTKAQVFLLLYGLDYCIVKGSNGDKWPSFGLNSSKQEYVTKHNSGKCPENVFPRNPFLATESASSTNEYKCPKENPKVNEDITFMANVSVTDTTPLDTETVYTVEKCFVMDHLGRVSEYIPDKTAGDVPSARVKVTPKFIEE